MTTLSPKAPEDPEGQDAEPSEIEVEIDWAEELRERYVAELRRPGSWFETAAEIRAALSLLEPEVRGWWDDLRAWGRGEISPSRQHGFHYLYMLLGGMAAENLLKGWHVQNLEGKESEIVESGELPKRLKTHNLAHLAKGTGLELSTEELLLLHRLSAAVIWQGRYPIDSTSAERHAKVRLENDLDAIPAVLEKLRLHVGAK